MTAEPTCHVVMTRFNVQTSITGGRDVTSPRWIEDRLDLFERFCLPSMQAQAPRHQWLVWFDARTPRDLRTRIEAHSGYEAIWVDGVHDTQRAIEDIAHRVPDDATRLITTRLDNDDMLAAGYLQAIRNALDGESDAYANFPLGYQWLDGRLYLTIHRSNPFLSYAEMLDRSREHLGVQSVWRGASHEFASKSSRLRQVWTRPMWLQVLHGGNVANELRGIRRTAAGLPPGFVAIPMAQEDWPQRQLDVARSAAHLAAFPWRRRASLMRRLRAATRR